MGCTYIVWISDFNDEPTDRNFFFRLWFCSYKHSDKKSILRKHFFNNVLLCLYQRKLIWNYQQHLSWSRKCSGWSHNVWPYGSITIYHLLLFDLSVSSTKMYGLIWYLPSDLKPINKFKGVYNWSIIKTFHIVDKRIWIERNSSDPWRLVLNLRKYF